MQQNVPSKLKFSNRKIIYKYLMATDGISRAELARKTGISGATVIKIIDFFHEKNIILYDNIDDNSGMVGRKPTPILFNKAFAHIVAIHTEGKYFSVGIMDAVGNVIGVKETKVPDFNEFVSNNFISIINELITSTKVDRDSFIGIGLAIPIAFDPLNKKVFRAPIFKDSNLDVETLVKLLNSEFDLPIFVENDVNSSAYGEYKSIYSATEKDLIYISLGTGLGCGIILDEKIRSGSKGSAGEIGYMMFEKNTQIHDNDLGWLERRINFDAVTKKFGTDISDFILGYIGDDVIDYLSDYLALAILNIYAVLDINKIILGGMLGNFLGDVLIEAVNKKCHELNDLSPPVVASKLKYPGFVGISNIVIEQLLDKILFNND